MDNIDSFFKLSSREFHSLMDDVQSHKRSSAVNGSIPPECEPGSLKNEIQVNAIRWPFLTNQINGSQLILCQL